jgi:hypothetical protein
VAPLEIPVTIPVAEPTVPIAVALLLHVPPHVVQLSVVLPPTHTAARPVTGAGNGLTVSVAVA